MEKVLQQHPIEVNISRAVWIREFGENSRNSRIQAARENFPVYSIYRDIYVMGLFIDIYVIGLFIDTRAYY